MAKKVTEDGEIVDTVTYEPIARVPPFWKTPWNHDTNAESDAVALECKDKTRTQQHLAADTEVAAILAKFQQTGEAPGAATQPRYMDVEELFDLQDQLVTSSQVEEAWNALTPEVRNTLRDPATFVAYVDHCMERGDIEPLRKLGLAKPAETPPATTQEPPKPPTPAAGTPAAAPAEKAPPGP